MRKDDASGPNALVPKIKGFISPFQEEEAKSMYNEFHNEGGHLGRQGGESMI